MKTARILTLLIILGTAFSHAQDPAQDCESDPRVSLLNLKDAVRRVTTSHLSFGFDDKAFNRAGDMAAVAIIKTVPGNQMSKPETVKKVLSILREAFGCPSRCVEDASNRQPDVTMLLLQHLHDSTKGATRAQVDETRSFVLQQTREVAP